MAAVSLFAMSPSAVADDNIIVNGLPCNALCRAWMGIKPTPAAAAPDDAKADPTASDQPTGSVRPKQAHKKHKALAAAHDEDADRPRVHGKHHRDRLAHRGQEQLAQHPPESNQARFWGSDDFAKEISARISKAPGDAGASHDAATDAPAQPAKAPPAASSAPQVGDKLEPDGQAPATPVVAAPPASEGTVESGAKPAEALTPVPSPSVAAAPSEPGSADAAAAKPADAAKVETPMPSPSPAATPSPSPTKDEAAIASPEKPAEVGKTLAPEPSPSASATPVAEDTNKPTAQPPAANAAVEGAQTPAPSPEAPRSVETQVAVTEPAEVKASRQVLIVLAKPDITNVADLRDQSVVVAGVYSLSRERMQASFAAEGASGLTFNQGGAGDVDQLWSGKVAAAIVAVADPEVAAAFHGVPGYRLLLVLVPPEAAR